MVYTPLSSLLPSPTQTFYHWNMFAKCLEESEEITKYEYSSRNNFEYKEAKGIVQISDSTYFCTKHFCPENLLSHGTLIPLLLKVDF